MKPSRRFFAFALMAAALLVSCSAEEPEAVVQRLAIIGTDGNVAMIESDGSNRTPLTDDAEFGVAYSQLTWSQQGSLAYTRASVGGGDGVSAQGVSAQSVSATIDIVAADGTRASHFVPFPPFYMYWSPAGDRIAYLGASAPRLQLAILDVASGESMPVLNSQPLYFDWSPDGDRIVTHHAGTEMQLLLQGEPRPFQEDTGNFFSPIWTEDGIYMVGDDSGQAKLQIRDVTGAVMEDRDLESISTSFSAGNDGEVAVLQRPSSLSGNLTVFGDVDTELSTEALWFFWSPTRDALVWMEQTGDSIEVLTWNHSAEEPVSMGNGRVSRYWIQTYLQFFDQYALSHSWWSPDGTQFLFFGTIGDSSGIWLLDASGESEPRFLVEGLEAVFEPG